VIAIIAKNNLVLETGHSSPAEALLLIREAKRQGVQNIVVTHATSRLVGMSVPQMKEAASLGAFLEFVRVAPGTPALAETAKALREVGPEFCILSSDLGQATNPLHPDGLLAFFQALKAQGITEAEIDRMAKANPAKVLGLKP
jgi:predicted metal-dependent phosphotriesterase family hydrolase